jgi:ribonucleotide monophosphatase NagD (HAD superfamily)
MAETNSNETAGDTNKSFSVHETLKDVIDRYDGFILDQFGVLHNGSTGLPGAAECVAGLAGRKKKLIILSNSGSLADSTVSRLPKFGLNPTDFVGAVTSGEEASKYVQEKYPAASSAAPIKALYFTWRTPKQPSPGIFLEECGKGVIVTDDPSQAELILLHGSEVMRGPGADGEAAETSLGATFADTGDTSDVLDGILRLCSERKVPMVCANPDFIMARPDGTTAYMPGTIAKRYRELGGSVTSFGKPDKEHFEACIRQLNLPADRVVHVGDSLHHDVAGANAAGIASVFVVGGVHREELGLAAAGDMPTRKQLCELFERHGQTPTHVVPMLQM